MHTKILLLFTLVTMVTTDMRASSSSRSLKSSDSQLSNEAEQTPVKFGYKSSDFEHHQSRDDQATLGSYAVRLPDGRLQKVSYYVDALSGYVAKVTYEGQAQYPSEFSKERRNFKATTAKPESWESLEDSNTEEQLPRVVQYGYRL